MTMNNIAPKHDISVVIAARPDRMRDSLEILLESNPWIKIVGLTDERISALELISQLHPALMILDTNIPNNGTWLALLKQVKREIPQTQCLLLSDTTQKQQMARKAGADAVLMKGFPAEKLFATITKLFPDQE